MTAKVVDFCLVGVQFSELYDAVTEIYEDTEIHWVFAENNLYDFSENRTVSEVASELARLSPEHALRNKDQLKDYADNRPYREVTNKTIGHVLRFRVPLSFFPYDERIQIRDGDFVMNSVNPVVCNPADTRPIGGLVNALSRNTTSKRTSSDPELETLLR